MKNIILLSAVLLASCAFKDEEKRKEPESEVTYEDVCNLKIAWKDIFNQEENYYLVYFYSEECGYCNMIKQEVLDYCQKEIKKMYFVDVPNDEDVVIKRPPATNIGISNIDEMFILGTPSMIEIEEKVIKSYYVGVQSIRAFISDEEDYNFSY